MKRGKAAGTRVEHKVRDHMLEQDWFVTRGAGSLGCADLVALRLGSTPRLVQVKSDVAGPYGNFRPADRLKLSLAAKLAGAEAWLAWWPPRGRLHWIHETEWPR